MPDQHGVSRFPLPAVPELAAPILEILPVQLTVHHLARTKGLPANGLQRLQGDTKVEA